ncbi:unnamed protein product [Closterium sp. Naga37s-1]|nr:unnamed protein product [Closterium sp. Naga37s-1]
MSHLHSRIPSPSRDKICMGDGMEVSGLQLFGVATCFLVVCHKKLMQSLAVYVLWTLRVVGTVKLGCPSLKEW